MKKVFFTLLAFAATCFAASAVEATFDFSAIDGFSEWGTSYAEHSVEYTEATVVFASANRQSSTITNMPVTKGGDVTVTMNDGFTPITSAVFECTQWSSKKQTISVKYSTDGETFETWEGSPTSDNFTLNVENVPDGTVALRFSFSSASNQVGISSLTVNYGEPGATKTTATVSFDVESLNIVWGDEFTSPVATTNSTAAIEYSSSNDKCATVDAVTGELTLVGNGTTTITAAVAANEEFTSAKATYVVIVTGKPTVPGEYDFVGWAFPGVYDEEGNMTWSNSYAEHVVTFDDATVTFASACKQSSTITDCPVTKGNPVTVALTNDANHIASFSAEFAQWGSKAQTVSVQTSTDGENFDDTEISTSDFLFESTSFDANDIVAIKFLFSEANNQIGVKKINIVEKKPSTAIQTISGEEGVVRYYNLQGVEVANPTKGIFVRVSGSKAEKVVVR